MLTIFSAQYKEEGPQKHSHNFKKTHSRPDYREEQVVATHAQVIFKPFFQPLNDDVVKLNEGKYVSDHQSSDKAANHHARNSTHYAQQQIIAALADIDSNEVFNSCDNGVIDMKKGEQISQSYPE